MPYHHALKCAVGLLFAVLLLGGTGCSSSVSDLISPTGDFWDRRPCVASERRSAPHETRRECVRREAPRYARRAEPEPWPAPQPRTTVRTPVRRPSAPPAGRPRAPAPARVHAPASVEEMRVLTEVNRVRAQHHLRALRFHPMLWVAAREHSIEQDRHRYMGHGSPDPKRRELSQRMGLAGYRGRVYAEVVAWGYPDVASVVEGWLNSPEHRRILLDPELTEAGFSRIGQYWTGNFGAPARFGPISAPRPQPRASRQPTTTFRRAPLPPARTRASRPAARPKPRPRPQPKPQAQPARPFAPPQPQTGLG